MNWTAQPASDEHDDTVAALFDEVGIPIHPPLWARAYGDGCPPDFLSDPWVVLDARGRAVCFAGFRRARLFRETGFVECRILHDFLALPSDDAFPAAAALVAAATADAPIAFAGGVGPTARYLLEHAGFTLGGYFTRMRVTPSRPGASADPVLPYDLAPLASFPPSLECINDDLVAARCAYFMRRAQDRAWLFHGPAEARFEVLGASEDHPLDAYAVLKTVDGPRGREIHVVEAAAPERSVRRLGRSLADIATARRTPLYASFYGDGWTTPLAACGFQWMPPRWPFLFRMVDPRTAAGSATMLRRALWRAWPADLELDGW